MKSTAFVLILWAVIVVVAGFVALSNRAHDRRIAAITSYQQCADAGYPIRETYPPQCATPDGRTFTDTTVNAVQLPANSNTSANRNSSVNATVNTVVNSNTTSNTNSALCINQCGDGVCQQVVCEGTGCPCSEMITTCPQDCPNSTNIGN